MSDERNQLILADLPVGQTTAQATALLTDGRVETLFLTPKGEGTLAAAIYVGKVERVQESIGGAFVRLGEGQNGFLPLNSVHHYLRTDGREEGPLQAGDELLVQVEKEAMRGKLPRLSADLSLAGTYLVVTTEACGCHYSKRLPDAKRSRLVACMKELQAGSDCGVIVRTNAQEADDATLADEYTSLYNDLSEILRNGKMRTTGSCLHREEGAWERLWRRFPEGSLRITTDDASLYPDLAAVAGEESVTLYQDALLPLYKLHNLGALLEKLESKRVWLSSGAFLVIEQTEAFVSVDVNTGKFSKKRAAEAAYRDVNREAAGELFRQLRLRELSGAILVDFINLQSAEDRRDLLQYCRTLAAAEPVKTVAVDFTKLGILELTREKQRPSLAEQLARIRSQS